MFCTNCGKELMLNENFCTKCGHPVISQEKKSLGIHQTVRGVGEDKWWHRLLKVLYVIAYLPLLGIIPAVWSSNAPYCYTYTYSGTSCYGSNTEAFWYSILTLVIYFVVLRLIKIAVLYVTIGHKPEWKKQFKKLF